MNKENRDDARPRLVTVHKAIQKLFELTCPYLSERGGDISNVIKDLKEEWEGVLNKHDINYNDLERWYE